MMDDEMISRSNGFCDMCGMVGGHTPDCWCMKDHIIIELDIDASTSPDDVGSILMQYGQEICNSGYKFVNVTFLDKTDKEIGSAHKAGKWAKRV